MIYFNQLLFLKKKKLIFLLPLKNRGGPTSMDEPPQVETFHVFIYVHSKVQEYLESEYIFHNFWLFTPPQWI